jgi:dTDP-glucose 4,6-dehydratase
MKTILVSGGAGFIGSNFIIYMQKVHPEYRIINLDVLTYAGNLENLVEVENSPNYSFVQADICDKQAVEKLFLENEIDAVINFAAESHVDRSILDPEIFVKTNVLGTMNLLNIAKRFWEVNGSFKEGKKFLQVSTDEVYGSLGADGYFTEETPLDPHSPYSASKTGADVLVRAYADTYGMPVNITRCSNNYGPYQFPEKLIPLIINNALNYKNLPVYGDGKNVRDWLYVEDHCSAIDLVLHNGRLGEVYNIGGHNERENIQIVKTILGYLNENVDKGITEELIKYVEDRKGHDKRYGIDPEKIRKELGWSPMTPFEEGIKLTIKWYLDNKAWVKNVTSGEYLNYYRKMYESR